MDSAQAIQLGREYFQKYGETFDSPEAEGFWNPWDSPKSEAESQPVDESAGYDEWLASVRQAATDYHNRAWVLADLILEGLAKYDPANYIPTERFMLIGVKNPNFYEVLASATGMAVQSLRNLACAARAFPPDSRHPALSFSHHAVAAPYASRAEYLAAAADGGKDLLTGAPQPPHTVDWLKKHIEREECQEVAARPASLTFTVPVDVLKDLKILAKQAGENIEAMVWGICQPAIMEYLDSRSLNLEVAKNKGRKRTRARSFKVRKPKRSSEEKSKRQAAKSERPSLYADGTPIVKHRWKDGTRITNVEARAILHPVRLKIYRYDPESAISGMLWNTRRESLTPDEFFARFAEHHGKNKLTPNLRRIAVEHPEFIARFGTVNGA